MGRESRSDRAANAVMHAPTMSIQANIAISIEKPKL
jgi:hypothetical protein